MWDIGLCLHGFHQLGFVHGDARIDNIGISENNFILFDFDGTTAMESDADCKRDIYNILKSIKFHTGKQWNLLKPFVPDYGSTVPFLTKVATNYGKYSELSNFYEMVTEVSHLPIIV